MNVFFDVDETILGYDDSLRPFVAEVFQRLIDDGHRVYVWSGARSAESVRRAVVERHGLTALVTDCFQKPIYDPRNAWTEAGAGIEPDFCVDDRWETIEAFGGVIIKPYPYRGPDNDMLRVYEAIRAAANHAAT
jgi:FMN phosphatase YigB (HAD superfamily)